MDKMLADSGQDKEEKWIKQLIKDSLFKLVQF